LWTRTNLVDYLLLAFFGIHLLSISWSQNNAEAIFSTMRLGLFVILYFFFKWLFNYHKEQAVTAITRSVCALGLTLGILAGHQLYLVFLDVGFDRFTVAPVTGLSGNKNILSGTLFMLLPFLLLGAYRSEKKIRWLYILTILLLTYILWQLRTRSILIATLVFSIMALLCYWYGAYKNKFAKTVLIAIPSISVVLFFMLFFLGYLSEVSEFLQLKAGSKTGTLAERFVIWEKSIELYKQHPFLGVGSGNWKIAFPEVGLEGLSRAEQTTTFFARPHNDWIQILCETGIIGGLLWISIWISLFWKNSVILGSSIIQKQVIQRSLILAGSIGFAVFSAFSYPLERIEFIILLALYIAFLNHRLTSKNKSKKIHTHRIFLITTIAFLGIASVYGFLRIQREYFINAIKDKTVKNQQIFNSDYYHPTIYSITPIGIPVKYYEGISYLQTADYNSAIKAFQEALLIAPNDLPTHLNIGVSYFRSDQTEKALYHYHTALKISPKHQNVLFNTAALYYKLRDKQKALEYLNKVQDDYPRKKEFLEAVYQL